MDKPLVEAESKGHKNLRQTAFISNIEGEVYIVFKCITCGTLCYEKRENKKLYVWANDLTCNETIIKSIIM